MTELMDKEQDVPITGDGDDIRQYLREIRVIPRLTPEEERELEAHLACCPACRALESQLAAIHTAFPLYSSRILRKAQAPADRERTI